MGLEKEKYVEFLKEQLELSGIPLEEAPKDEKAMDALAPLPEEPAGKEEPKDEPEEKKDKEAEKDQEKEPETELADSWEIDIKTSSKFKFEMHENYIYVWYRSRRSDKIPIPTRLRAMSKPVSELFNKMMSHIEKVS
jgi:hypothetical protein